MNSLKEYAGFNFSAFRRHFKPGLLGLVPSSEDIGAENIARKILTQLSKAKLKEHYQDILDDSLVESKIKAKRNHERRMNRIATRYFEDNRETERIKHEVLITDKYYEIPDGLRGVLHDFNLEKGSIEQILNALTRETFKFRRSIQSLLFITDIQSFLDRHLFSFYSYEIIRASKDMAPVLPLLSIFKNNSDYDLLIQRLLDNKVIESVQEDETFDASDTFFDREGIRIPRGFAAIMFICQNKRLLKPNLTKVEMSNAIRHTFNLKFSDSSFNSSWQEFLNDFDSSNYKIAFHFLDPI